MNRRSVRSYSKRALGQDQLLLLEAALKTEGDSCPFGNRPRFKLIDPGLLAESQDRKGDASGIETSAANKKNAYKIGTYGIIKHPPAFIIGAVSSGKDAVLDYGYALEGIVLAATALGLGTCWLGGTFDRGSAKHLLNLKIGEIIPAITPVGLAAENLSLTERTMRFFAGSDARKPWDQLFFDGEAGRPLDKLSAGPWVPVLEAVRFGPSASNKQPWRILREGSSRFNLLFAEDKAYNNALGIPIQELDIGIAMKHFALAAEACGLPGKWSRRDLSSVHFSGLTGASLRYVASWDI